MHITQECYDVHIIALVNFVSTATDTDEFIRIQDLDEVLRLILTALVDEILHLKLTQTQDLDAAHDARMMICW